MDQLYTSVRGVNTPFVQEQYYASYGPPRFDARASSGTHRSTRKNTSNKEKRNRMTLRHCTLAVLFALVLLTLSAVPQPAAAVKGPRSDDLILYYYADVESAYTALKAGHIDMVGYELTADLFVNATSDLNIVVDYVADAGCYEVDLNNNYTIPDYPGIPSPMGYQSFRQSVAFLLDKDWVVEEACGGFAERIDQMIAAPYQGWANASMWYPNYPYEYDPTSAAALLDATGFVQGATPNPDYDPTFPSSAEYLRTYPPGHPLAGQDLHPLVACVRTDDTRRLETGRLLVSNMEKHGIPITALEGPAAALYDRVMGDRNYHIYTGSWSAGRFPPVTLYYFYHSNSHYPYGPNYVTGVDAVGAANYPHLMTLLEAARFPDTYAEAVAATKAAAGYITELCVTIPLFSPKAFWAWRTDLLGVVNMDGSGPENRYTFLNAYKLDGSAIRYGLKTAPVALNIFYSTWYYDQQNLNRMNLAGGVDVPPYDLSVDQTGFVTDRVIGTWDDGGVNKSKVTYTYRPDGYFVEPVTGNQLANVNASHVYASIWYHYQLPGHFHPDVDDVHHLNLVGPYTLEIYFDSYSYWHAYAAQPPITSFHLLRQGTLSAVRTESISFTGPDYLGLSYKPFWVTSISGLGGLTQGTDWEIVRDGPSGDADVYIYKAGTGTVDITYYSAEDATGYTPGNLPWETAFEGAGAWYATASTSGVGGSLTLHRNPFYYMETPLLGEIDWVRKPNGAYKIDIFDIVMVATGGTYHAQALEIPDPGWLPGADVAPQGGVIDIFDIVTITGKYGQEFDLPP